MTTRTPQLLIAISAAAILASPARSQCMWTLESHTGGPFGYSNPLIWDASRQRLYSVVDNPSVLFPNFLFRWWDGHVWTPFNGSTPPRRTGYAMAYDAARDRLVIIGGRQDGGNYALQPSVWEWNGAAWSQVTPALGGRVNPMVFYDSLIQRVIMFGGWDTTQYLGDTRAWDGATWTLLTPAQSPSPRASSACIYDEARHRAVLYGGYDGTSDLAETWEWDGATWIPIPATTQPGPQWGGFIEVDRARARVVYQSRFGDGGTWEYDGVNWTLRPHGLDVGGSMGYDGVNGRVVVALPSSLWVYDGNSTSVGPWVVQNPGGVNYYQGATFTSEVQAGGTPPLSYQWLKGTTVLQEGPIYSGVKKNRLTVTNAGAAESGNYSVRITNACGQTSAGTSFTVIRYGPDCYANCDRSWAPPALTANDFQCFLGSYAAGSEYANCDGSTSPPVLTANDFQCYLNAFAAGCS